MHLERENVNEEDIENLSGWVVCAWIVRVRGGAAGVLEALVLSANCPKTRWPRGS